MAAIRKFTPEFLNGKKFAMLTWMRPSHKNERNVYHDVWLCDCGKEITLRTGDVVCGRIKSCSCQRFKSGPTHVLWTGHGDITGAFWASVTANAKNRKIELGITIEEAWDKFLKQDKRCAFTGEILTFSKGVKHDGTASLDRVDSSKPYSPDNVQWIHKTLNYIKRDLSDEEFFGWCRKIATYKSSS